MGARSHPTETATIQMHEIRNPGVRGGAVLSGLVLLSIGACSTGHFCLHWTVAQCALPSETRVGVPFMMRSSFLLFVSVGFLFACSGRVDVIDSDEGDGDGDFGETGGTGSGGLRATGGAGPSAGGAPGSGGDGAGGIPYVDPKCPDDLPPPIEAECDPLFPYEDCREGEGCYPYLQYPAGDGCGFPTFGAVCAPASTGEQGAFCGEGGQYCAPGFMCVVGAAGGRRCGQVCKTVKDHGCPAGLICGETDVQGFGVCF